MGKYFQKGKKEIIYKFMNLNDATTILEQNYNCTANSFIYELHEHSVFSKSHFWDFYDSVIALAKGTPVNERTMDTAMKITVVYQHILKEIIYHFDENDGAHLKQFPSDYTEYIARLDDAIDAYFRNVFVKEELYFLQR